jgi:hypothetical protein
VPAEQVLASFSGHDGAAPLYGVIAGPEKILFSFGDADGSKPGGNVAADAHGDLFGETVIGGPHGAGEVFELRPAESG